MTPQGTCGCVQAAVSLGPVNVNEQIGCFALGAAPASCPATMCELFSDCGTCDTLGVCGWCGGNSTAAHRCMAGSQNGPSKQGACAASGGTWTYDKSSCSAADALTLAQLRALKPADAGKGKLRALLSGAKKLLKGGFKFN